MEIDESEIPEEFKCPITLCIMKDPVIMPDGQTYERKAIENALNINSMSPITRKKMKISEAIPNYALKSMIENFLKNHGEKQDVPKKIKPIETKGKEEKIELEKFEAKAIEEPENEDNLFVSISIEPQKQKNRIPLLLISMIDVSGSMGISASENIKGGESVSFSRLALVKHALKTVGSVLEPQDKMSLISFNSKANMIKFPTNLSTEGKNSIFNAMKNLEADGSTNIWDALRLGIEEAKKYSNYNICLMLFTDGEPNVNPPMGIVHSLKEVLSDININFTISTFAFGYNVDSELMQDIAKIGNGVYGYCPDCTMVGTIFTNYMANMLSTSYHNLTLNVNSNSYNKKFDVGGLYNGVQRHFNFSIPKKDAKDPKISLLFKNREVKSINKIEMSENKQEIMDQYYRNKLIELITNGMSSSDLDKTQNKIKVLFNKISNNKVQTDFMKNLLIDLINNDDNHGQVEKSFRREYYDKWGKNYLYSFLRFHILEQCGNFKDQSLQLYGGNDFKEMLKKGNKIFITLPPPENDLETGLDLYGRPVKGRANTSASFANLCLNASGGCFNGDAIAHLINGKKKKVREIRKGDILSNGAIVECLVENQINGVEKVVEINKVLFSPYHPIELKGKWVFPCENFPIKMKPIDCWYNLVLKSIHEVELNGIKAITLGHNRTEGVLKHPYFGTDKVINALKKYDSYEFGIISTSNLRARRNEQNLIESYY